jgi:hypothetical protein
MDRLTVWEKVIAELMKGKNQFEDTVLVRARGGRHIVSASSSGSLVVFTAMRCPMLYCKTLDP